MRRPLGLTLLLLVIGVPTAHASDVQANVALVSPTQAYLSENGNLTAVGDVIFEWGTTTSYGFFDVFFTGVSGATGPSALPIGNLDPGTAYHARVRLTGAQPVDSGDVPFTTPPLGGALKVAPAETFVGATALTGLIPQVSLFTTCVNSVTTFPGFDTMSRFRAYTIKNPAAVGGCVTAQVTTACSALEVRSYTGAFPGTTYDGAMAGTSIGLSTREYQFPVAADGTFTVVVADDGTCSGGYGLGVFSTSVVPPTATSAAAAVIGPRSATLKGTASARLVRGTQTRFEWDRTTAYTNVLFGGPVAADDATHAVSKRLTGLLPNTVYHARLVTSGPGGVGIGTDVTFRTLKRQPALRLAKSRIAVGGSTRAAVPVICPLTTTVCTGRVVLRRADKRRTKLGSKTFTIAGGTTGSVAVPLSTSTRRLVKRLRVVKITAALLATDGDDAAFPDARRSAKLFWRG